MTTTAAASSSTATAHAIAFVAAHRARAEATGQALADHLLDPDALAEALRSALASLADPAYLSGQQHVAPGLGTIHGVRQPLLAALGRGFRRATRQDSATSLIEAADRLLREPHLEAHWFAFGVLERTVVVEPERSWQLLRRAARLAADWITVDTLAHAYAAGVAAEPYRWAELELLVFSPKPWERRLVGSTIATMTHGRHRATLGEEVVRRALPILEQLIGDDQPDVQKALAWAYRSLAAIDRQVVTEALARQADLAVANDDGHRAWVVRDTLAKLADADAGRLRERLTGIRRRPGAPSTAVGTTTATRFGALPDPTHWPEPPLA